MNGKSQTGLVCGSSVDDYENDLIKKHEFTRPEKELDRINHIKTTGAQTGNVFLAYKNVDAIVSIEDVNLSLLKSFPKANVTIEKLSIVNKAPFAGKTLVASDNISLKMSVMELFNSENEPMKIESIATENTVLNIIFNKEGLGNYDIAIKDKTPEEEKTERKGKREEQ